MADHNPTSAAQINQWLVTNGYQVILCESGAEALSHITEHGIDLLIVSMQLPDLEGNDVCRQIKADDRLGFMPIIMLEDTEAPPLSGDQVFHADIILPRPFDLEELGDWIEHLLHIKRQFTRLMRENERLNTASQSIDALKRDIISNVSHELRTPLVQVKAAVSLLVEDIQQNGTQEQPAVAEMAQQAVARLESVVENIRQLAQSHDVRTVPVNVSEAADLAQRFLERSWISRDTTARLERYIPDGLPLVRADKRALARLLQLLIDNALKFSNTESPVHIIARQTDPQHIWIGVRDFGIGIPPHEHDRVFDAFYQVDGSSTRRYGGTGSGLALAGLLARSMQTVIRIDSTLGEGSTFYILLPIINPEDFEL